MKQFHLGDILSITTGRLVAPRHIEAVYDLLGYMAEPGIMTHQIPRVARLCAPCLLEQHPALKAVEIPPVFTPDIVPVWLAEQVEKYGEYLPVTPLENYVPLDPITELELMVAPGKTIAVVA